MAYSDFSFTKLKMKFGIDQESVYLFQQPIKELLPSQHLTDDLELGREMPLYSEKAKSEVLIFPIIRELKRKNKHISIFSGYALNIEGYADLTGVPDFMISANANIVEPQNPIFCLMESKNKAPDEGFAQCAAEMYAARLFNQENNEPYETIYGVVTNAYDWVFMKLEGNTIFIDKERYFLNELPKLLGILQFIVNQYKN